MLEGSAFSAACESVRKGTLSSNSEMGKLCRQRPTPLRQSGFGGGRRGEDEEHVREARSLFCFFGGGFTSPSENCWEKAFLGPFHCSRFLVCGNGEERKKEVRKKRASRLNETYSDTNYVIVSRVSHLF